MNSGLSESTKQEYATKLTIIGIFLSVFMAFVSRFQGFGRDRNAYQIKPFDLILLGLATLRLGRLTAYDQVTEPLRYPFTKTVEDQTGAGKTVEPRQENGFVRTLGQLISCPICSGTWIAAGLVYALHWLPSPTRLFLTIMSTTGILELLDALLEALNWVGQLARTLTGENISH